MYTGELKQLELAKQKLGTAKNLVFNGLRAKELMMSTGWVYYWLCSSTHIFAAFLSALYFTFTILYILARKQVTRCTYCNFNLCYNVPRIRLDTTLAALAKADGGEFEHFAMWVASGWLWGWWSLLRGTVYNLNQQQGIPFCKTHHPYTRKENDFCWKGLFAADFDWKRVFCRTAFTDKWVRNFCNQNA